VIMLMTRQILHVYRNMQTCSVNHSCSVPAISITYSECVFLALVSQHAMRIRLIILSSVARPAVQYFFTLLHNGHDFRKNKLLNIKCVFTISVTYLSPTILILRRTGEIIINVHRSSHKVPVILVSF
jgi:hypothetical protein